MLSAWCRHCRRLSGDRVETVLHSVGATVLPSIFITLEHVGDYLARPAAESRHGGQYVLLLFIYLFIYFSTIRVGPIISKSTRPTFAKCCRFGRTMAVADQSEISFSIAQWALPW